MAEKKTCKFNLHFKKIRNYFFFRTAGDSVDWKKYLCVLKLVSRVM